MLKKGSLASSMILGKLILHKTYSLTKYVSVLMVTAGIIIFTLASYYTLETGNSDVNHDQEDQLYRWFMGVGAILSTLFISSYMGVLQESFYKSHGKQHDEMFFYLVRKTILIVN